MPRRSTAYAALALCGLSLVMGCPRQIDIVATLKSRVVSDGGTPLDSGSPRDSGMPRRDSGMMPRDSGMMPRDSGMMPRDSGMPACGYRTRAMGAGASLDELLAQNITRAICACNAIATSDAIHTRAATSEDGGIESSPTGGVGVNDALSVGAGSEIGGALVVAGADGISLVGDDAANVVLRVVGDLAVGGPLQGAGTVQVTGNAAVADRVQLGVLQVTGQLTQPTGASYNVADPMLSHVGGRRVASIEVKPPCACGSDAAIDFAAFGAAAQQKLSVATSGTAVLDRACAEYALGTPPTTQLTLQARAPAALYVGGDLHLTGDLVIETANGADVDLFVAGNLKIDGTLRAGDATHSARVRIFVADTGTLPLAQGGELHGVLYAPAGNLVLSGPLTIDGALAIGRLSGTAAIDVAYAP